MGNLKKLAYTALICIFCVLTIGGCAGNTQASSSTENKNSEVDEYSQLKLDTWNTISENIKATLSEDWKNATVSNVKLSGDILEVLIHHPEWKNVDKKITSSDVYEVLEVKFHAANNSMLGDLHVFVDPDSKKVIGYGPRA